MTAHSLIFLESANDLIPYLEAGFCPYDLPNSISGYGNGKRVVNYVGEQPNCMSCHGAGTDTEGRRSTAPAYRGDRDTALNDPSFQGPRQVDLLWSIPGHAK